jgi:uncharacterized protein YifE (UPF0438 family)
MQTEERGETWGKNKDRRNKKKKFHTLNTLARIMHQQMISAPE